jgi:hypothetical protein
LFIHFLPCTFVYNSLVPFPTVPFVHVFSAIPLHMVPCFFCTLFH